MELIGRCLCPAPHCPAQGCVMVTGVWWLPQPLAAISRPTAAVSSLAVTISAWWCSQFRGRFSLAVADTIPVATSRPVPATAPENLSLLYKISSPQTVAYGEHHSSMVTSPTATPSPAAADGCWLPKLCGYLSPETTTSTPAAPSRPAVPSPLRSRQPCGDHHRRHRPHGGGGSDSSRHFRTHPPP